MQTQAVRSKVAKPAQASTLLRKQRQRQQAVSRLPTLHIDRRETQAQGTNDEVEPNNAGDIPWNQVCRISARGEREREDEAVLELATMILNNHLIPKLSAIQNSSPIRRRPYVYVIHTSSPIDSHAFDPQTLLLSLIPLLQDHVIGSIKVGDVYEDALQLLDRVELIRVYDAEDFESAIERVNAALSAWTEDDEHDARSAAADPAPRLELPKQPKLTIPSSQDGEDSDNDVSISDDEEPVPSPDIDIPMHNDSQPQSQPSVLVLISSLDETTSRLARRNGITAALSFLHPLQRKIHALIRESSVPVSVIMPSLTGSGVLGARKEGFEIGMRDASVAEAWKRGFDFEICVREADEHSKGSSNDLYEVRKARYGYGQDT